MKKAIFATMLFIAVFVLYSIPASDFVIGAYSKFSMSNVGSDYFSKFSSLGQKLYNTGFNTVVFDIKEPGHYTQPILGSALNALEDKDIKTILQDYIWQPTRIGSIPLSYGFFLNLEAEYSLDDSSATYAPDELEYEIIDDRNNIAFKRTTGASMRNESDLSNQYAWTCSESQDDEGVVLSYPRRRWKNSNPGYDSQQYPSLLSEEISFLYSTYYNGAPPINSSRIFITFAVKCDSLAPGEQIASFTLKVLDKDAIRTYDRFGDLPDPSCYDEISLIPCAVNGQTLYGSTIVEEDSSAIPLDRFGNRLYEFYIDPPDLSDPHCSKYILENRHYYHFSPEVYWHGNGVFTLDYITIEDNIHKSMRLEQESSPLFQKLETQLNSIYDPDENVIMHYGRDEHYVSNFDTYKLVEAYLESMSPPREFITVTNTSNDWIALKNNGEPYHHQKQFLKDYKPKNLMIDCYALSGIQQWKEDFNNQSSIQRRIDDVLHYFYYTIAKTRQTESPMTKLYFTPQNHGIWKVSGTSQYWSPQAPPKSMIKCLQLLPLCYDADGIVSFAFANDESLFHEGGYWVTPYSMDANCGNLDVSNYTNSAVPLAEANRKLSLYGPIIQDLDWITANRIMPSGVSTYYNPTMGYSLNDGINLSQVRLDGVNIQPLPGDLSSYHGYVQAGYYLDINGLPCFMLVNRRAVLKDNENSPGANSRFADITYVDAPPQTVRFDMASSAPSTFGTQDVAFIDPYDYTIYKHNGTSFIDVEIEPGDGKLLQLAGTPALVENSDVTANTLLAIKGGLCVNSGSTFTITPGTKTFIGTDANIQVQNNSTLVVEGDVRIGRNAQIKVELGGSLVFNNARVTYLPGSKILSNSANISIVNSEFIPSEPDSTWEGIVTSNESNLTILNSRIVNAKGIHVFDTNLQMDGNKVFIPAHGFGMNISDRIGGVTTEITSSDSTAGFFGPVGSSTGLNGITIWATQSPIVITNQRFTNLMAGVYCPFELLNDVAIEGSSFYNCYSGIRLLSSSISLRADDCSFISNVEGISAICAVPLITGCTFSGCETGIFSEFSTYSGIDTRQAADCIFVNCNNGVVSRGSNAKLVENQFSRNNIGILSHVDSNLNLSVNANNRFENTIANLSFQDNDVYKTYIQLVFGHNDFYHTPENSHEPNDFNFDDNYYEMSGSSTIFADYNWFQDQTVKVNDSAYSDYVVVNNFDQLPSSAQPLQPNSRFYQALNYESQGLFSQARTLYQQILEEKLDGEEDYLNSVVDGLYRLANSPDQLSDLINLYNAEALDNEVSNPQLSALLKDYLTKGYVNNKDYQSAIDLLQTRIINAVSEVDSLCAVLDLEIVLYLASNDEAKKPLATLYQTLIYPTPQIFDTKHSENWSMLKELTGETEQILIPVINHATIISNYPNPFNPSTTIEYSMPDKGLVCMQIFNLRGQLVDTLINGLIDKGSHKIVWDGRDCTDRKVGSGIYFIQLISNKVIETRKMMLIK